MKRKQRTNPFYVLLVLVGVAFCLTATSYGILTLRDMRASGTYDNNVGEPTVSEATFMRFVDENAVPFMAGELVVLALATVGAIGTDGYWSRNDDLKQ